MLFLRSWIFSTVMFALLEGGEYIFKHFDLWAFLLYLSAATGTLTSFVYHVYENAQPKEPTK